MNAVMAIPESIELEDFDALVHSYRPRIVRLLTGMLADREAAEDLAQECFLKAHQASEGFRGEASTLTWLMKIAINLAHDYRRSRRLQFWRGLMRSSTPEEDYAATLRDPHSSPEGAAIARQQAARVWRLARKLPEQQRAIFLLRFVEEMDLGQIAAATSLAEGTVKAHLFRAVRALRKQLE